MKKERYKEKKNSSGLAIFICLILTLALFVALVVIQKNIINNEDKVTVVVAKKDIPAKTVIDAKKVTTYFEEVKIVESLAYDGVYTNLEDLFGDESEIYIEDTIIAKQIVGDDVIVPCTKYLSEFKNPVEMGIKVSSFEHAAGGTLRRGDNVNLCSVDEFGNEYSISLFILKAFDASGVVIEPENKDSVAVAFTVVMEDGSYTTVAEIIKMGTFDLIRTEGVK